MRFRDTDPDGLTSMAGETHHQSHRRGCRTAGIPWQEECARIAPNPEDWPTLVAKVKQLNLHIPDWPAGAIQSIRAPPWSSEGIPTSSALSRP